LILSRNIGKSDVNRRQILRLKCTKFDFCWSSAPDPAGGAYSAPPYPLAGLRRRNGGERRAGGKRKEREGRGEDGEVKEGVVRGNCAYVAREDRRSWQASNTI